MSYYLAASLKLLRDEVNTRWPNRSKVSDGWIGDTAHSNRVSDHNPDYSAGGVVRALDITSRDIDVDLVLKHTTNDSRVAYVIHNHRIYTHSRGWYAYNGSNPHTSHIHVSIAHTRTAERDTKPWITSGGTPTQNSGDTKSNDGDPNRYTVRTEQWIRDNIIPITKGTDNNSTPHIIGLYQLQQIAPFELHRDQIWGSVTDGHYRWVHAFQVEANKWKGKKLTVDKSYGPASHARVRELQRRNHGGAYPGWAKVDGVAGPVFCNMLGINEYPN